MKKSKIYELGLDFGIKKNIVDKIILYVTKLSKTQLFLLNEIDNSYSQNIINNIKKLSSGVPLEYIIKTSCFYSLDFFVDSRVLIPRNDTEILVDKAIETIIKKNNSTLIDIGTGSSCIAISVMKNTNKIKKCYVIDISNKALEVSLININKFDLQDNIVQIKSNLLEKLLIKSDYFLTNNIIITANLPYIKDNDYQNMDTQTIKYEPALALFGGEKTGFEIYENLIYQVQTLKNLHTEKNITLFIEIGFDQYDYSKNYLNNLGLNFFYYLDNNGIKRCIKIIF